MTDTTDRRFDDKADPDVLPIVKEGPEGADLWERVPYDPADYGPVEDWANDFDHAQADYNPNAPEIWKELREGGCPVAHSDRYGGMWVPLTHDTVNEVAYDTENFSSRTVVVSHLRPGDLALPAPIGVAPPITSDPPFHNEARRLLLPPFAPKKIEALEPEVRQLCRRLLADMGDVQPGDTIDAAVQYAQNIPISVIRQMLGFPEEDEELFRRFIHNVVERVNEDPRERMAQAQEERLDIYIDQQIQDHIDNPRDDLTSFLIDAEIGGEKLHPDHVRGTIILLLIAGTDTTWSVIGSSLWHLAQNPDDRRRLREQPELIDYAVEEFLRAYASVTMSRMVAKDHDFHGCPMKKDDWLLLPFPAANRDPKAFEDPDKFIIDREENRHAAFGLGIHRCLGSNLARLELKIAIQEFVARFPDFELDGDTRWSVGMIRGPRDLPVRILETA